MLASFFFEKEGKCRYNIEILPLPSDKSEYPPLLPVGLHVVSVTQLVNLCVTPFPLSSTRKNIMHGLQKVLDRLDWAGVEAEVWVNGSFLTQKMDPEDSDIAVRVSYNVYESGTAEQRAVLDWLGNEDLKPDYLCHSFFWVEWPVSHPMYWVGEYERAYWLRQWGFSRGEEYKGIAVVKLGRENK